MSRLIHDPEQDKQRPTPDLVINDEIVLMLLKACQSMAVDHGREAFLRYLKDLDNALSQEIDRALSNQQRIQLTQLQKQVWQQRGELERYFCGYLAEGFVKFRKQQLHTLVADDIGRASELALLDNEKLEESIAISSISQRADVYFAEPLWALHRRLSVLNKGQKVSEENNPAAPVQFCESLRRTLKLLTIDATGKAIAYRVFDRCVLEVTGRLVLGLNDYLKEQGVLPHLRFTLPSGNVPESSFGETLVDTASPPDDLTSAASARPPAAPGETQLLQAIHDLQSLLNQPNATQGSANVNASGEHKGAAVADSSAEDSSQQLLEVLSQLQVRTSDNSSGNDSSLAPADVKAVVEALAAQLGRLQADGFNRDQMQTIDLVGMLFEYMLNDENLPDAIKTLLSYLHTPFLKLAFVDPGFFEQTQHPARLLLNNLAEAGARWVRNDGNSQFGIYEKIKNIVDKILRDFDNDVRVIAELLFEFSSYTKDILRRQELMEKRATEKAKGEEKLRAVKVQVNEEVRLRTDGHELPSAVLLLLLQPWSDFLSFTLLRYGESSVAWNDALAVVDDIVWCIAPKVGEVDRKRQRELYTSIVAALESGLETIGFDQAKSRQLVGAISSLIEQVMQRKNLEPAPAPMRSELERIAAEKAGANPDATDALTEEEARMVDNLKMIEFGTWFEFEDNQRLKVAWYNNRTAHYMLVDQMGKRAAMMSGVDLARAMIAGKARVISGSSKPFFDRALENIFLKLNAQAEALRPNENKSE